MTMSFGSALALQAGVGRFVQQMLSSAISVGRPLGLSLAWACSDLWRRCVRTFLSNGMVLAWSQTREPLAERAEARG
jgi:hypothetical protein